MFSSFQKITCSCFVVVVVIVFCFLLWYIILYLSDISDGIKYERFFSFKMEMRMPLKEMEKNNKGLRKQRRYDTIILLYMGQLNLLCVLFTVYLKCN